MKQPPKKRKHIYNYLRRNLFFHLLRVTRLKIIIGMENHHVSTTFRFPDFRVVPHMFSI